MNRLTIGQVAKQAEIGVETVRFYERQGLLVAESRTPSGYRQFDEQTVARLRFIRRAKDLGFTLNEIRELLSLKFDPSTTCADVKQRAESKICDIEAKLATLQKMKQALERLTRACGGSRVSSDCPILEALNGGEEM